MSDAAWNKRCHCGALLIFGHRCSQVSNEGALEQRLRDLEERVEKVSRDAAEEICSVFDVTVPRGKHFANSPRETIRIIVQQKLRAELERIIADRPIGGGM